jgi:carboxylesterase type B
MGAWHNSELPLLFGTHSNYRGSSTTLENETSIAMQDAWVSFVGGGVQGLVTEEWPLYETELGSLREFGRGVAAQTTNYKEWESLCPEEFQP